MLITFLLLDNFLLQIWVGIFGLIAGLASFRSGWQATALPSAESSEPSMDTLLPPIDEKEPVVGFDAAMDTAMSNVIVSQEVGGSLVVAD